MLHRYSTSGLNSCYRCQRPGFWCFTWIDVWLRLSSSSVMLSLYVVVSNQSRDLGPFPGKCFHSALNCFILGSLRPRNSYLCGYLPLSCGQISLISNLYSLNSCFYSVTGCLWPRNSCLSSVNSGLHLRNDCLYHVGGRFYPRNICLYSVTVASNLWIVWLNSANGYLYPRNSLEQLPLFCEKLL